MLEVKNRLEAKQNFLRSVDSIGVCYSGRSDGVLASETNSIVRGSTNDADSCLYHALTTFLCRIMTFCVLLTHIAIRKSSR